jgi:hypothetical protein
MVLVLAALTSSAFGAGVIVGLALAGSTVACVSACREARRVGVEERPPGAPAGAAAREAQATRPDVGLKGGSGSRSREAGQGDQREVGAGRDRASSHVVLSRTSRPRSRLGTLCVIQPTEIKSTPEAAMRDTVSKVTRPDASVTARPLVSLTASPN